tara:strand:- start:257 stop:622 length:366 start_codon:yes stop_codon:yes gene_type:complete
MVNPDNIRTLAAERYSSIQTLLHTAKLVTVIVVLGAVPLLTWVGKQQLGSNGATIGFILGVIVALLFVAAYIIFSFVRPVVDSAINGFINQEILLELLSRHDQLVEIEKFKLQRAGQKHTK